MNPNRDAAISPLERENDDLALQVAREGIVLLSNCGSLPLHCGKVALYGAGARNTVKGGTGSGEVNNRRNISVEEGLKLCGFEITTKDWLDDCDKELHSARAMRDEAMKKIAKGYSVFQFWTLMEAIALPIIYPCGRNITEDDVKKSDTDTAVYVLARQAGEGADRRAEKGEYDPSDKEIEDLKFITQHYKNTVLVVNAGACIQIQPLLDLHPGAVVFMGQAGQAGGLALAQLLKGKYNFSGKLVASWPKKLSDLPCADSYSYLDGNTEREIYKEGIYVGYRFYDTFQVEPQYPFGFGLSYTEFEISAQAELCGTRVKVTAAVKNAGKMDGKEVVQVYLSCPSDTLAREYQQLAAFVKTDSIAAGCAGEVSAEFDLRDFAAYDEGRSCFVLERGNYTVRVGNHSRNTKPVATIVVGEEIITERCRAIGLAQNRVRELKAPACRRAEQAEKVLFLQADAVRTVENDYEPETDILPKVRRMSDRELTALCVGDPAVMNGRIPDVVGACGQIDRSVCQKYGYRSAVMADGPAGLRIAKHYAVEPNGKIKTGGKLPQDLVKVKWVFAFLDRLWSKKSRKAKEIRQFCTAWPSATVQAQSFAPGLIREVGRATSKEMEHYGVSIWLAPGMNIQRFPLCGRNYEYYSEDPLLTAKMASALTLGVQENKKCAVTVKHFCCNNQEDNRMRNSSEVNERALREIYLKAFRWTIKYSHPKCVMSAYNKVNGQYVNSSRDLIWNVLRCEFGHSGIVMTDWQSVARGQAVSGEVLSSSNDLIMAGDAYQHKELYRALKQGKVDRATLEQSASRILKLCKELNA